MNSSEQPQTVHEGGPVLLEAGRLRIGVDVQADGSVLISVADGGTALAGLQSDGVETTVSLLHEDASAEFALGRDAAGVCRLVAFASGNAAVDLKILELEEHTICAGSLDSDAQQN